MAKKNPVTHSPTAWKARLTEHVDDATATQLSKVGSELFNHGLVTSFEDFLSIINDPDKIKSLEDRATKMDRSLGQRITDRFNDPKTRDAFRKTAPLVGTIVGAIGGGLLAGPPGAVAGAGLGAGAASLLEKSIPQREQASQAGAGQDVLNEEGLPIEGNLGKEQLEQKQRNLQEILLALTQRNVPQEISRLQSRRDMPFYEQAYGPTLGRLAQAQERGLQQYMLRPQASYFTGDPQQYNPSGSLLGITLGNLASQGIPKAYENRESIGTLLNQLGSYFNRR